MFEFFKKKELTPAVTDMVWVNNAAKCNGLIQLLKQKPGSVLCAWFDETVNKFTSFLAQEQVPADIYLPHQLPGPVVNGKPLIFLEHHPFYTKEQAYFKSIKPLDITVITSLDEPLMLHFGSDNIKTVMQSMGVPDNEPISHNLITVSIQKAQMKLEKLVQRESPTHSMQEWFKRNVG